MPFLPSLSTQSVDTGNRLPEDATISLCIFSIGGHILARIETQLACYGRTIRKLVSDTLGLSTLRFRLIGALGELCNEDMLCERISCQHLSLTIVIGESGADEHSDD